MNFRCVVESADGGMSVDPYDLDLAHLSPMQWEAFTPILVRPRFVKRVMVILIRSMSLVPSVSTRPKRSTEGDRVSGVWTKQLGAAVTWSASLSTTWTGMPELVRRICG